MTGGRWHNAWAMLGQACRDAVAAVDVALDCNAARPARLKELRRLIQTDGSSPYARAASISEVQRFLADPLSWAPPGTPATSPDTDLAGAFVPRALEAQTLAFGREYEQAASAMREARSCLAAASPEGSSASSRRHRETLRALAGSFERGQLLEGGLPADDASLAPSGEVPAMSYLFEQDAESALKRLDYKGAVDAITRAIAVADAPSIEQKASYACQAGSIATTAYDKHADRAEWLLEVVERRLLRPLAEPAPTTEDDTPAPPLPANWAGEVAFWRGLIALQQAKCNLGDDAYVEAATARSLRSFLAVKALDPSPETVEAAESWISDVERLRALAPLRQEGRTAPAVSALEDDAPKLATLVAAHERCRWDMVDAALRCDEMEGRALAAELGSEMARFLSRQRNLILPVASSQRLVLEISRTLLADDPEAKRLLEGDPSGDRPNVLSLRTLIQRRYGITLPGVLVRMVDDDGWLLPLLDGTPMLDPKTLAANDRFAAPYHDDSGDWLSLDLTPDPAGDWDVVEYAAWSLGQAVLGALPELVGLPQLRDLGLDDLPPARILPFVRILLADRTMLTERQALRARAIDVAQGRLSSRAAAEAFRRLPAVRGELWGVAGQWASIRLAPDTENELARQIGAAELATTVPRVLLSEIDRQVKEGSDGIDRQLSLARSHEKPTDLKPGPRAAAKRLVVRDPLIRPFLRAQTRKPGSDFPVVTEGEIDGAA